MFPLVMNVEAPTDVIWWTLFRYYLFLGFAAGAVVTVWMLYWILKYRQKKDTKAAPNYHHEEETGWGNWKTVVMTLLLTGGVLGFVEYQTFASVNLITPPTTNGDPIYINVTGQQFAWSFDYGKGHIQIDNLTVPVNEVVILNITSIDVDHSFSIDTLSVAKDAIPGTHNFVWFNATQTGFFMDAIRCKELCGIGHAGMIANFTVVSQATYNAWYSSLGGSSASNTSTTAGSGPTQTVDLPQGAGGAQQLNFNPSTLTVAAGTTITFSDQDTSAPHNIYFTSVPAGASTPATSSVLNKGDSYSVTLTTPGTYKFECQFHPGWMQGTIVVTG